MKKNDAKNIFMINSKSSTNRSVREAKFFSDLFLTSPIGIYIVQDGKFRFVNPEFQKMSGYREQELLGTDSWKIVHPDDRNLVRENAVSMLKGERSYPYVYRVLDKVGDIVWIIETVTSIYFGGRRSTLGYFMDNTERERTKEAMALSEEKFEKAFRSSPDWMVISTLEDGFYVDVNEAFLNTTGYRRDEVLGHTSVELGIWADPRDRSQMVSMLREQGKVRNLETRFRVKGGDIRIVLWSAEIIDYGGEKCLIAVTRDITEQRIAEQERLRLEKLHGVLEISGAACHELNQPLQHIYFLLNEMLEADPESKTVLEIRKQFERIKEITGKLENIDTYETMDYVRGSKIVDIHKSSKKE